MSWLSAVTGKAEDFLNRLDKSAADVLHTDDDDTNKQQTSSFSRPLPVVSNPSLSHDVHASKSLSPSQSVPVNLHSLKENVNVDKGSSYVGGPVNAPQKSTEALQSSAIPSVKTVLKKKDSDEALFDFLNSKDPNDNGKKRRTPKSSHHHSRQSSTSSIVSSTSKGAKSEPLSEAPVENVMNASATATTLGTQGPTNDEQEPRTDDSPTNSHMSADIDVLTDALKESPTGSDRSVPESDHVDGRIDQKDRKLSSLELENRLLRNEVASLNQEMASAIKRAKDSESDMVRTKEMFTAQANSVSMHDQLVRELQAREHDLTEALNAKDSQLAVLRVRLEEADRRVSSKEKSLEEIKSERERILKDHCDSSGMHNQALDAMKEKLEEVEAALRREQSAYKQAQKEAGERQGRLQQEQISMVESMTGAEKRLADERGKLIEMGSQLKAAKAAADASRKELSDYKEKAARILLSKERLISSLREGGTAMSDAGVSYLEHESLRQEKDMLREELQQMKLTVENLRQELQDVENQLQQESDTSQDTIRSLEDTVREEKRRREDAEQELLKQKQELQYALDELHKQKSAFQARVNDREADIEKLRNQLMTKSMSSNSENELESRVRSLTESLIQKQTVLEALSTEKNSLILQLERMEQQNRDLENAVPRPQVSTQFVAVNDHDDDVRQRLPMFLREVATDHEVTRRMKRAANSIDGFSIRLGVFLRRYPIARVFVIVYMALLHVWVLIVMMTYQPEIHSSDFQPQEPQK